MNTIILENVSKVFRDQTVLKNISHTFESGLIHGIVGRNGSGKTVMFKLICGLAQPTEGRILIDDKQIGKDIDMPDSLGAIINGPGFIAMDSGMKNLQSLASIKRKIGKAEIINALTTVGLDWKSKKHVGKYSSGMKQRLAIAQAIMEAPDLLILDEPFNGLDDTGLHEMRELLLRQRDRGATILLTSHNYEDIRLLCDRVSRIDAGMMHTLPNE